MKCKILLMLISASLIGTACSSGNGEKSHKNSRPNIVLIISDDQSWTDYSFLGHEHIETPRLDQLAAEGLTFKYGYTTAPLCSPALASIATGLYPHQHGILGNDPVPNPVSKRNREEWLVERMKLYQPYLEKFKNLETIADLLGANGYTSLQVGKWWLGNYANGGFDEGMTHGDPLREGRHGDVGLEIGRKGMEEVYEFIDKAQAEEKPFYVWYAPFLPHTPHNPPDSLKQKYLKVAPTEAVANYWAMCEWFDITCGQLMDYVEDKDLSKNTLFVYVTDNGWIQDPDKPNRYAPRSKRDPHEMGIRTPMMFRWLGEIEPRMDNSHAVSSIDIATTILDICDIESPKEMQGINVLNKEELNDRDLIFAETYAHDFSTLDSSLYYRIAIDLPYKLILPDDANKPDAEIELYNLHSDPFETKNMADINPEKVKDMSEKINLWWNKN